MHKLFFPILVFLFVDLLVFRQFFISGLLPIPGDILIGAYFPWLDYKWGYEVGVPVKNPLPSDVISLLYPWRSLAMSIAQSGNIPLWDPTILLGTPLLANFQSAVLNPLNVLFLFFAHPLAWSIEVITQPVLISMATFLYLKNLGLKNIAATFGGLVFAFSGFSLVWMEYNTIGYTLIFFPLALLFVDKLIQKPRPIFAFLLALSLCLQLLSGYPQITVYTVIFSTLYFLYRLSINRTGILLKTTLYFVGIGSSLLLSAVQLLPSLELLNLSIRAVDKTAAAGGIQFLPLPHLITFLIPDFFGNPATGNYWSGGSYDNFAFYLPAAAVFFALSAIFSKTIFHSKVLIFTLFAGLSLLLATDNPISKILTSFDLLGLRSAVAARALFVFDFSLAVLAAVALERVVGKNHLPSFRHFSPFAVFTGIVLGLGMILLIFNIYYPGLVNEAANIKVALKNSLPAFMIVGLLTVLVLFKDRFSRFFIPAIFILLIINIVYSTDKYFTFTDKNLLYPQTEATAFLKENIEGHRFDREKGEIFPSNTWIPYGLKTASGQNALSLLGTAKYLAVLGQTFPSLPSRFVDVTNVLSPLYNTLDIKYLTVINRDEKTSTPDINGSPSKYFLEPPFATFKNFGTVRLLENQANLGMAWFSTATICSDNEKQVISRLSEEGYDPQELIFADCPAEKSKTSTLPGLSKPEEEAPNYLKIHTDSREENYLTLSQAFHPGWEGYIDGKKTDLYRANLALTAIPVPAGSHTVELKYQPQSFWNGLKISLASLFGWIAILIILHLKRNHV